MTKYHALHLCLQHVQLQNRLNAMRRIENDRWPSHWTDEDKREMTERSLFKEKKDGIQG